MRRATAIDDDRRKRIGAFYALALTFSWAMWAPRVAGARGVAWPTSSPYLHLAGSLGPALAALAVLAWTTGRAGLRQLVRQTLNARAARVAAIWAVVLPTVAFALATVALARAAGQPVHWSNIGVVAEYPALGRVGYALASLVFYGFGEEIGWRGFLYPLLRQQLRPLWASLVVVPFWAIWHVPLFFATDSYRAMGPGAAAGWLASLVSGSLLTSWLTDRARGSILPAAMLHAVLDIYFLADVGVPTQSVLGAIVTLAGVGAAIALRRAPSTG
jgi:membrane protease YdiL (CAAX protease family)